MMLAVCLGTWAGAGLITGATARYGTSLLGAALLLYALTGLASVRLTATKEQEPWLGPIVGAATGLSRAEQSVDDQALTIIISLVSDTSVRDRLIYNRNNYMMERTITNNVGTI
jgi:hypothetical protein